MTQFLSIVWPSLDDTSNRQLSDAFPLWSRQLDPVGSEDNIYSCQAENQLRMVTSKRHLIACTVMMRICVKSFLLNNESMVPFYITYDRFLDWGDERKASKGLEGWPVNITLVACK